ncbi:MAG: deoxyribodipyrimidine photo-lyase [Sulfurospirillaceae bacterium]|nr:deoxyribodipyrimidine photo-lyase [Sulfurospirillaceae bacterium]
MKKILWFRRDLRVEDNPLLSQDGEVLPIFIFDENILKKLPKDDRRVDFIFKSVVKLKENLKKIGLDLALFFGKPKDVFEYLKTLGFSDVYASVDYDSYALERDKNITNILNLHRLNDTYIFEPNEILKKDSTPYLVFTPYYNMCKKLYSSAHSLSCEKAENRLCAFSCEHILKIENNTLTPLHVEIKSIGFTSLHVNYQNPKEKLEIFKNKIENYSSDRDFLDKDATSHLSVDLRFGTISIREVLRKLEDFKNNSLHVEPFFRQLVFRDFYAYLLFHFPHLQWENYQKKTPTSKNREFFERFESAQTGYPLIDASINELLQTGYMHNRARMVVGSFFTKHLLLPWQDGEAFFAKHLLDYEASSNILSWQWCAGTGIDPQPYYRVFNPFLQSKKFDKNAQYIKKWLPQLDSFEPKNLHNETFLIEHTIQNYPKLIVFHEQARKRFLKEIAISLE